MIKITRNFLYILSKKQKKKLVLIIFMMLFGAILEAFSVSLILPLVSTIMNEDGWDKSWYIRIILKITSVNSHKSYVIFLLLVLIVLFLSKNIYLMIQYYVQYKYLAHVRADIHERIFHSYLLKPYSFYLNASSGYIIRINTDNMARIFGTMIAVLNFYTEVIVAVAVAIAVLIIDPIMAVSIAIIMCIELVVVMKYIKPIMKREGVRYNEEATQTNKWVLQTIQGIKSIKVASSENFFEKNYRIHMLNHVEAHRKQQFFNQLPRFVIEAFTVVSVLIVILIMILVGVDVKKLIPILSAFVVAAIRLLPSINRMSVSLNAVQYVDAAMDEVMNVLADIYDETTEKKEDCLLNEEFVFNKIISLENICFSYDGSKETILENAEMVIAKGESVGIIGVSGAGKTTLVDLILGLLKPKKGGVFVDGKNIHENLSGWIGCISYIPQNIFMMDASIRENIVFGQVDDQLLSQEVIDERLWKVLEEAQLVSFVKSLPEQLDTVIGEAGIRLSGGQRQRLGIARALFSNPDVLIFDEATSALDNETEEALMEAINKMHGKKTMIIIAHRLSTIEKCDAIYKVENKRIIKQ